MAEPVDPDISAKRDFLEARQHITGTASVVSALFATLPFGAIIAFPASDVHVSTVRDALRVLCCLTSLCSVLSTVSDLGELSVLSFALQKLNEVNDAHFEGKPTISRKESVVLVHYYIDKCCFPWLMRLSSLTFFLGFIGLMGIFMLALVDSVSGATVRKVGLSVAGVVEVCVCGAFLFFIANAIQAWCREEETHPINKKPMPAVSPESEHKWFRRLFW